VRGKTCDSKNVYHLALGPLVMIDLVSEFQSVIPEEVNKKIEDYAEEHGENAALILVNEEKMKELATSGILSEEDNAAMMSAKDKHNFSLVERAVRKMNGSRILKHPHFEEEFEEDELAEMTKEEKMTIFYEEIFDTDDIDEIVGEIHNAVFKFRYGLDIEEKSKLLSLLKEGGEVEDMILQSNS
jgi:hypothetical protein